MYKRQDEETLCNVREWQVHSKLDYLKEGACILHIISELPGVFKDVDAAKVAKARLALSLIHI